MTETTFKILNRWTKEVQFECSLPPDVAAMTREDQIGFAVKKALEGGADLTGADLQFFKQDLIAEILRMPNELEALQLALMEGRIDGSTYAGKCAVGTLAKASGVEDYIGSIDLGPVKFHADASLPREQWFTMIRQGQKPEDNQAAALALEWVGEAIAIRDNIRGVV